MALWTVLEFCILFFLGGGSYKVITKTEPVLDTPGIDIRGHKGGEENR